MYKSRIILCLLIVTGVLFSSCRQAAPKQIIPAFYYWRSTFKLDSSEQRYVTGPASPLLYIRFFDVTWNGQAGRPVPVSPLHFIQQPDSSLKYIPVVFITDETMRHCSTGQMSSLASHILEKINSISEKFSQRYHEIQIDCDWTVSTKDKYFTLLKNIRQQLHADHILLSVTLRLHQIKYISRTGVPPADRGMLMFYNMGDWRRPQTSNSIYDLQVAGKYLSNLSRYPLPLDIALPLLRWTIVYRNGKFLTFLNYVGKDELAQCDFLNKLPDNNRFTARKDTFVFGCNLRKGDLLRSEACSFEDLMEGKRQLLYRIRNTSLTLALFHLDQQLLKHYSHARIEKIFSAVQ